MIDYEQWVSDKIARGVVGIDEIRHEMGGHTDIFEEIQVDLRQ